jgi:hypothetical protein
LYGCRAEGGDKYDKLVPPIDESIVDKDQPAVWQQLELGLAPQFHFQAVLVNEVLTAGQT